MAEGKARLRVAILYGGRSPEHEVSILSATNVIRAIDPSRYEALAVFVTRDGRWLLAEFTDGTLTRPESGTALCLLPGGKGRMLAVGEHGGTRELPAIDILFPLLHGMPGEDGSVQGLADVARVPLAGCGMLGSAAAIDKDVTKRLLKEAGLPVARCLTLCAGDAPAFADVAATLGLPLFVKPARQGSSVGVSKVGDSASFAAAVAEGFRYDSKLLAEEFLDAREVELSVLERPSGEVFVSRPGEIVRGAAHVFYSYEAKYVDADGAALAVPATLPEEVETALRKAASSAFRATGCDAMARIDFFLKPDMSFVVNEINTIPGFTDISMYSKALAASGVAYTEIIDTLIAHGLARAGRSG